MKWRVVMLRKLAVFIVFAGLTMSPLLVQALGFGGIKLKSSLNEKLDAEVALLSASANDVQSLKIKLATEEAFLRSGIDRTALLNKLRFKVKQRANGDYYIHVTTTETVREPFMNFLLEMDWKNGRMLREYTMLIDPPGRAPKQIARPAPVVAETIAPEPEPVVEEEPVVAMVEEPSPFVDSSSTVEPVTEPELVQAEAIEEEPVAELEPFIEPEQVVDVVEPVDIPPAVEPEAESQPVTAFDPEAVFEEEEASDELWPRIPLSAYKESDHISDSPDDAVDVIEEDVVEESSGEMGDLDYGITKANDNLWSIAEKLRQGDDSVTVYQIMMALLQSNPDAFIDNNVHRLKVGHVLRIDDPSVLTSLTRKEAANSFIEQTEAWDGYRQQVAEAAGEASVQPIIASEEPSAESATTAETSGELTLTSPDSETLVAGGGASEEALSNDLATMQDQLQQAKADAAALSTQNPALNKELKLLEEKLNSMQRSLSVKDDELAAFQLQLSNLDIAAEVAAPEPTVAETAPVIEQPVVEEKPVVEEQPVAEEQPPAVEEPQAPVEIVTEAETTSSADSGIMDTVMGILASIVGAFAGINLGSDTLLFIAAPIILVLLIIVVIVVKRRRQGDNFQESILTGAATTSEADASGAPSADSSSFSEESSFLSDFAMSGASAIEADDSEVDPLTEADVFIAYGRYEAAEERLNEAIQSTPDRMELRAKLLELYNATQNKAAFESSAEDFYASLGGNEAENPLWAKVVGMGREIAPENPLFNQGGGGAVDIPATSETPVIDDPGMGMTDSQVMDIGLETGVFAAADMSASTETSADAMDFNLDLGMDDSTDTAPAEPAADMDFNLDIGMETDATEEAGLDFNLDVGGADADTATEEPAADLDLNFDMETTESADDGAGLDFDLDMGSETETTDAGLDFDTGSSDGSLDFDTSGSDDADLGGGDEVGTKLDLAKAYIDMGDPDGARSILDEVMDEGSSTQKEEAQSLLGQIA